MLPLTGIHCIAVSSELGERRNKVPLMHSLSGVKETSFHFSHVPSEKLIAI
ncbi:unnamed protein product [Rodentolepis nana]|uniref:Uncharacterized protein n=1 Tax=Rodentolepis nana TaxID=102285 RepID=A0A0R3TGF4_RODNA|nr:unnamed protein product [Rodentolepis nana]